MERKSESFSGLDVGETEERRGMEYLTSMCTEGIRQHSKSLTKKNHVGGVI